MRPYKTFTVLLAMGLTSPDAAAQVAMTSLGNLVCSVGPGTKKDIGGPVDSHNVVCVFAPSQNGPEESYAGTLMTAGLSAELVGQAVVIFAVRGARDAKRRVGMLEQTFFGSVADADGAKGPLAGDLDDSLVLDLISKSDAVRLAKPATASVELKLSSATG